MSNMEYKVPDFEEVIIPNYLVYAAVSPPTSPDPTKDPNDSTPYVSGV